MSNWQISNPCPGCGRTSGQKVQCTECKTLGCGDANCVHGGSKSYCTICQKVTKKVNL